MVAEEQARNTVKGFWDQLLGAMQRGALPPSFGVARRPPTREEREQQEQKEEAARQKKGQTADATNATDPAMAARPAPHANAGSAANEHPANAAAAAQAVPQTHAAPMQADQGTGSGAQLAATAAQQAQQTLQPTVVGAQDPATTGAQHAAAQGARHAAPHAPQEAQLVAQRTRQLAKPAGLGARPPAPPKGTVIHKHSPAACACYGLLQDIFQLCAQLQNGALF